MNNLFSASSSRKLNPVEARDLVAYVKLLNEIEVDPELDLKNKSKAEVIAMARKLVAEADVELIHAQTKRTT